MKTFIVEGHPVKAEGRRAAVKYYMAVLNREPETVEDEAGKTLAVTGICESTGLGIFEDDINGVDYHQDSEGIIWLTEQRHTEEAALAFS